MVTRDERLDAAIAQHPQLWNAMGDALTLSTNLRSDWAAGQLAGLIRSLCIVGQFDQVLVKSRLEKDFA